MLYIQTIWKTYSWFSFQSTKVLPFKFLRRYSAKKNIQEHEVGLGLLDICFLLIFSNNFCMINFDGHQTTGQVEHEDNNTFLIQYMAQFAERIPGEIETKALQLYAF